MDRNSTVCDPGAYWPLPALLRGARATFGSVIRRDLNRAGYDDIPPNGLFVVGALDEGSTPLADVITTLGVSKQTAGALVDTLVVRGYLDRATDPSDRRRMVVSLSDRGAAAAAVIRDAVSAIESALESTVGSVAVAQAKLTLAALTAMGRDDG